MSNPDLVRLIDSISRDKSIDKESVFVDIETAMVSAARKQYGSEDVIVAIDRLNGEIRASVDGESISMKALGRIAAQTAKQVMIQRIREAERGSIFEEYSQRVGTIVTGTVTRFEGGALAVNLGRAEGYLPRSEQIPGESHHPGERVRAMILDVREAPYQVKIVLTRTHPDYIRRLFEIEVPEVSERIIEIRALAREAGYRTKVAVASIDMKVDAVGACVGVRGSRIRNIVDELGGEKIDIVRWNESSQILIGNALKPAEVQEVALCFELGRATVVVAEDQLSLAIGKRGQNVRLAARLTGWDIDILTPAEYNKGLDDLERTLKSVEGVEDVLLDKLLALGLISLMDIKEVGIDPLLKDLELTEELAARIVTAATEGAARIAEEQEQLKAAEAEKVKKEAEAAAAAEAAGEDVAESAEEGGDEGSPADDMSETGEAGDTAETAPQVASVVPVVPDGAAAAEEDSAEPSTDVAGESTDISASTVSAEETVDKEVGVEEEQPEA
jgi:transcription termination/antitermination protein NusA